MSSPESVRSPRRGPAVAGILLALVVAACDGSSGHRSPTAPSVSAPPTAPAFAGTYTGNPTLVSPTPPRDGCGWWGSSKDAYWWWVQIEGDSIELDEEMEIVFRGPIRGHDFVATWIAPDRIRDSGCPVRRSTIAGTFSEDRSRLEALETTEWADEDGRPVTTERRWALHRV